MNWCNGPGIFPRSVFCDRMMHMSIKRVQFVVKSLLIAVIAVLAVACTVLALGKHFGVFDVRTREAVLIGMVIIEVFIMVAFALDLKNTLKDKFFSYRNILMIAAILFMGSFLLYHADFLVRCFTDPNSVRISAFAQQIIDFPKVFANAAIPVLLIICLLVCISNIALIRHEGFRTKNLLGVLLGAFYIGGTIGITWLVDFVYDNIIVPYGIAEDNTYLMIHTSITTFLVMLLCYFECVLFGAGVMGLLAVKKKPSHDRDVVIILGCQIDKKGGLLPLLKGRTNRAIRFAWEQEMDTGKQITYIPSGGQGANEVISEASAMQFYLLTHGADSYEVFPEKKSRNTNENFIFSKRIIDDLHPGAKIAFVTTNYHILRSGIIARYAGIDAEGIPSKTKWYFWPNGCVREFFAILAMHKKTHASVALMLLAVSMLAGHIVYII